jgi:hypothetical protein
MEPGSGRSVKVVTSPAMIAGLPLSKIADLSIGLMPLRAIRHGVARIPVPEFLSQQLNPSHPLRRASESDYTQSNRVVSLADGTKQTQTGQDQGHGARLRSVKVVTSPAMIAGLPLSKIART